MNARDVPKRKERRLGNVWTTLPTDFIVVVFTVVVAVVTVVVVVVDFGHSQ